MWLLVIYLFVVMMPVIDDRLVEEVREACEVDMTNDDCNTCFEVVMVFTPLCQAKPDG